MSELTKFRLLEILGFGLVIAQFLYCYMKKNTSKDTQKISAEFWRELEYVHKENLLPVQAEYYVAFAAEMTRDLSKCMGLIIIRIII